MISVSLLLVLTNLRGNVMTISSDLFCEARKSSNVGKNSKRSSSNSRSSTRRKIPAVDEYNGTRKDLGHQFECSDNQYDNDEVCESQAYDRETRDGYDDDCDVYTDFEQERECQSQSTHRAALPRSSKTLTRVSASSHTSSQSSSHKVAPYVSSPKPSAFSRGFTTLRESIPDSLSLKNTLSNAKEATAQISSNLYREVKGLSSSELEQVFLKVTIPNDLPVKDKHLERLLKTTYQSARLDIYSSALRKLWSKMTESDWRTTIKAVYVLHRYSTDGAREHQPALKQRLREMRRTRDPKKKAKYFNTKQLLEGDSNPKNKSYRAFLARYAHYVLLRVQCFGGMFLEIAENATTNNSPSGSSTSSKEHVPPSPEKIVITSTRLKKEHLDVAKLVLKDGLACMLKPEEVCEITAHAIERVASDMIGLITAVAIALNYALKYYDDDALDKVLIKLWCEFYVLELLPETRAMIAHSTPILDKYGLFLPSKMGTRVAEELLQKGMDYELEKKRHDKEILEEEDQAEINNTNNKKNEDGETNLTEQDNGNSISEKRTDNRDDQAQDIIDEEQNEYEYEYEYDYDIEN